MIGKRIDAHAALLPYLEATFSRSSLDRDAMQPLKRLTTALALALLPGLSLLSWSTARAVDEAVLDAADQSQQTVTEGSYSLPRTVDYDSQTYSLTGRPLSTDQMKLMMPGVTWVYYREDGTTQWEYHTFDGYVLRWNENSTVVVAGAWQIIDNRICWTYNQPFCRRIWRTERSDLFAVPIGPDKPLLPARFEIGDPLGLANRTVHWLVTQSQDANERQPLNPSDPVAAPQVNPDTADRAIDERGAPQLFTLE
ncbi:MAG: hypothetical protein CMM70_00365 [Rhodospirillaceae bacterium]|nr:hypothetical protein [Rhodospirillaceae bacterium]